MHYMDMIEDYRVWMVSVDQDHTFPDHHLLQLGIRLGYLTVVSRVPCARVVRRVRYPSSTHPPTPTHPPRFTPILGQYPSTQYPSLFFDGYVPIPNTHEFWWVWVGGYVGIDCGNSLTPGGGMEGIKNVCLSKSSCCLVISSW